MALNEIKAQMLSIITHISVQEMIDIYMVTFLAGIQTCPLGPSPLGSNGPLGPSPLGSGGVLGPNLREHSHSESMAMMIITMISTRIDTQKRMGGDTALWLKAFVEVKK